MRIMNRRRGVAFGCWALSTLIFVVGCFPILVEAQSTDVGSLLPSWLMGTPPASTDTADLQCSSDGVYTCDYPKIENNQQCLRGKTCAEVKDGCVISGVCDRPNHCNDTSACGKAPEKPTVPVMPSPSNSGITDTPQQSSVGYPQNQSSDVTPTPAQSASVPTYGSLDTTQSQTQSQQSSFNLSTDGSNYSAPTGQGVSPLTDGTLQDVSTVPIPVDSRVPPLSGAQDTGGSSEGSNGVSTFPVENGPTPQQAAPASSCGFICSAENTVSSAYSAAASWISNEISPPAPTVPSDASLNSAQAQIDTPQYYDPNAATTPDGTPAITDATKQEMVPLMQNQADSMTNEMVQNNAQILALQDPNNGMDPNSAQNAIQDLNQRNAYLQDQLDKVNSGITALNTGGQLSPDVQQLAQTVQDGQGARSAVLDAASGGLAQASASNFEAAKLAITDPSLSNIASAGMHAFESGADYLGSGVASLVNTTCQGVGVCGQSPAEAVAAWADPTASKVNTIVAGTQLAVMAAPFAGEAVDAIRAAGAVDTGVTAFVSDSAVARTIADSAGGWTASLEAPTFEAAQTTGGVYSISDSAGTFANTITDIPSAAEPLPVGASAAPADVAPAAAPVEELSAAQFSDQIDPAITAELEQANGAGSAQTTQPAPEAAPSDAAAPTEAATQTAPPISPTFSDAMDYVSAQAQALKETVTGGISSIESDISDYVNSQFGNTEPSALTETPLLAPVSEGTSNAMQNVIDQAGQLKLSATIPADVPAGSVAPEGAAPAATEAPAPAAPEVSAPAADTESSAVPAAPAAQSTQTVSDAIATAYNNVQNDIINFSQDIGQKLQAFQSTLSDAFGSSPVETAPGATVPSAVEPAPAAGTSPSTPALGDLSGVSAGSNISLETANDNYLMSRVVAGGVVGGAVTFAAIDWSSVSVPATSPVQPGDVVTEIDLQPQTEPTPAPTPAATPAPAPTPSPTVIAVESGPAAPVTPVVASALPAPLPTPTPVPTPSTLANPEMVAFLNSDSQYTPPIEPITSGEKNVMTAYQAPIENPASPGAAPSTSYPSPQMVSFLTSESQYTPPIEPITAGEKNGMTAYQNPIESAPAAPSGASSDQTQAKINAPEYYGPPYVQPSAPPTPTPTAIASAVPPEADMSNGSAPTPTSASAASSPAPTPTPSAAAPASTPPASTEGSTPAPTPTPTQTSAPTAARAPAPTAGTTPTPIPTATPASTPSPAATPAPAKTPVPNPTPAPKPAPTKFAQAIPNESGKPFQTASGQALADATGVACAAIGCDAALVQKALAGVCSTESGCNAQVLHVGNGYQGLFQADSVSTGAAMTALKQIAQSPKLSTAQKAQITSVINTAQAQINAKQDPNKDSVLGAWIGVGYQTAAGSLSKIGTVTNDPGLAAAYGMLAQIAPDTFYNFSPNKRISTISVLHLQGNNYWIPFGATAADAARVILATVGQKITTGINWSGQFSPSVSSAPNPAAAPPAPAATPPVTRSLSTPPPAPTKVASGPAPAASAPPSSGPYTKDNVTIVGDSIGQGTSGCSSAVGTACAGTTFKGNAVSGAAMGAMLKQINALPNGSKIAVIAGTNNYGETPAQIGQDVKALIDAANAKNIQIVAWAGASLDPKNPTLDVQFAAADTEVKNALPSNIPFVDLRSSSLDPYRDGYHYTAAGYKAIGDMIIAQANTPASDSGVAVASSVRPAAPAPTPAVSAPDASSALQVPPPAATPSSAIAEASSASTADFAATERDVASAKIQLGQTKQTITADKSQLASLQTQEAATVKKIAAYQNTAQATTDLSSAKAGLDVLNTLGRSKTEPTAAELPIMTRAAAATVQLAKEIGDPALSGQINEYVTALANLKAEPSSFTKLTDLWAAESKGAALVTAISTALDNTSKNLAASGSLASLQTTSAKLATNIANLNTTIASLQQTEVQQVAEVTNMTNLLHQKEELAASAPTLPHIWKPPTTPSATTP